MNRIRPFLGSETLEGAWPPASAGFILVERLRCFVPSDLFAAPHHSRVVRVLIDYPGAVAKLVNYVLLEGVGATLAKTRTKLDQKRARTDLAMSAVGMVADAPPSSGLAPGDVVACGGFLLPVEAEAYLLHPDQCRKVDRDADGLERHFWLGALMRLASSLAESGARSVAPLGWGPLEKPLSDWLSRRGWLSDRPEAAIVSSAFWARRSPGTPPAQAGVVLDPFRVCRDLPAGWRAVELPDPATMRVNPLDRRPLAWPFPFEPSGRDDAIETLLAGPAAAAPIRREAVNPRRRVDLDATTDGSGFGVSIVGCGNFARAVLLYNSLKVPGVTLRGICDIRPEVAAVHARALGAAFHTADFNELLADAATQAVLVTSDHGSHARHVAAALDARKAVHVEKPPAVTPEQLTLMLGALARSGGTLTVGYNRPYAPAYPLMMNAIVEERGPVTAAMIVKAFKLPREHWYYWPEEGTRLAGNLCHWIDLGYRVVLRARPVSVHVMRDRSRLPVDAADGVVIAIRFEDASLISIAATTAGDDLRGVREWIHIGRGGTSIRIDDFDRLEITRGTRIVRRRFGRDRGHAAEIRDVVRKLRARVKDDEMISDMVMSSAILFAAVRSFDTGREEEVVLQEPWRSFVR